MPVFLDEISLMARAGNGGDGSVHFARRKYQPYAGPDGGDGGKGGDVLLVGDRGLDSLEHLRRFKAEAQPGAAGSGNLKIGAGGADCPVAVPLGTIAYQLPREFELGAVTAGGAELTLARGGRGGKGNPHYATGSRRTPKLAESGREGEELEALLRYRIYAESALIEPGLDHGALLLPRLLGRDYAAVDWPLYQARPRWARVKHDYNAYDVAYLPAELNDDGTLLVGYIEHAYWAQSLVINLLPLDELAEAAWPALAAELTELPLRRCEQIVVLADRPLFKPWQRENDGGQPVEIACLELTPADDSMAVFAAQLLGGTVS
ncbi:hypothetical protein JW859_03635 [bacterium]|nr:hypothetical protein [bacterium]